MILRKNTKLFCYHMIWVYPCLRVSEPITCYPERRKNKSGSIAAAQLMWERRCDPNTTTAKQSWSLPQSRQSAKLFLQASELGLPQPLTRRRVCPPPLGSGARGTLAGERGVGRVPIPTRGHTLWYSLYIRTLWSLPIQFVLPSCLFFSILGQPVLKYSLQYVPALEKLGTDL
jgi:hypothetical protein